MTTLKPTDFWRAFWQIIQSHALLWHHQGVAHGDISLKHMLCEASNGTGILTDFDLSTTSNHTRNRRDMLIMPPFKSMQLLFWYDEPNIPQRYDHELESFTWVLVWVSRRVVNVEECKYANIQPWRPNDWLNSSEFSVYLSKNFSSHSIFTTPDHHWLESPLQKWIDFWTGQLITLKNGTPSPAITISEYLQIFIDICTECAKEDPIVTVPIDVSWVQGALKDTLT
jgi:hypothetical protein